MFSHPKFEPPPDDAVVWQYVKFDKLLAMLDSRKLYFRRLDRLDENDPREGTWSDACVEYFKSQDLTKADEVRQDVETVRRSTYINCWTIREQESELLWYRYCPSAGIAIKTTALALIESIPREISFATVRYSNDEPPTNFAFDDTAQLSMVKRLEYRDECEVRLLKWLIPRPGKQNLEDGCAISVDLERLIDTVVLSPRLQTWFLPHLKTLFARFGLPNVKVQSSTIYVKPTYLN